MAIERTAEDTAAFHAQMRRLDARQRANNGELTGHFPARGDTAAIDAWVPIVRFRALSPKVIVAARTRIEGAWAAYIDAVPGKSHRAEFSLVLDYGTKLDEKIARLLFHEFDDVPYAD